VARHRAALAEALRGGPAARVADARDRQWDILCDAGERVGRDASPSAAIIDSQSIKTTEAGAPRGYDAGKKVNGRKCHALVDTDGRGLVIEPHPASVQDRDGGGPLLSLSRRSFPFIERVFADAGYAGERVAGATSVARCQRFGGIGRRRVGTLAFSCRSGALSTLRPERRPPASRTAAVVVGSSRRPFSRS
jgi:hypothetical protein